MIVLLIYLLFFAMALALVVMVFRRLRPRGLLPAAVASLLSLCGFALFFPVPIHGGFTFPLEMLLWELKQGKSQYEERSRDKKREAFEQSLQWRFAGTFAQYDVVRESDGWAELSLPDKDRAWLDRGSGLVWRGPEQLDSDVISFSRQQATLFCQHKAPRGYWTLPTEAEMALLWEHNGHHYMPGTGHNSAALLVQDELQIQMMTQYRGSVPGYALRCVAISENAPRRGYVGSDIPLSLWNRFQINKAGIYSAGNSTEAAPFSQEIK